MRTYGLVSILLLGVIAGCGGNDNGNGDGGVDGSVDGGDPVCGDSVVEDTEECDDGDSNSDTVADACRLDCTNATCGDGVVDTGEECDGENQCENCVSVAVCGDEAVGGDEECDGGEDCHPAGHVRECTFIRRAFQMSNLALVDPGFWIGPPDACGANLAETVNEGLAVSVNGDRASDLAPAESLDGLIDLGFVFTMAPLRQGDGETTDGEFVLSDCTYVGPFLATPCTATVTQEPFSVPFSATSQTSGTCLEAVDGTTGPGLTPPVRTVEPGDGACWVSDTFEWTLSLGSIAQIPLSDVQVAAQWNQFEFPPGNINEIITGGLIRGFLTREDAEPIIISLLGGLIEDNLASILSPAGGAPICQHADTGPNGEDGWWMYLHFDAIEMPWDGGPSCGDGIVDAETESCDTGIASGNEGACDIRAAADCDDGLACTQDTINLGDPCNPLCFHRAISDEADGCCPLDAPSELPDRVGDMAGLDDPDCT